MIIEVTTIITDSQIVSIDDLNIIIFGNFPIAEDNNDGEFNMSFSSAWKIMKQIH